MYLLVLSRSLSTIPEETLRHFKESAESVIEQHGAVNALSAALAIISGSTKIVPRSLLSSREVSYYLSRLNQGHYYHPRGKVIHQDCSKVIIIISEVRGASTRPY